MTKLPGQEAEGAELGNEVEGYLLWQATIAVAEQRAREFVQPMEWLTTAQREEIEQLYVSDSLRRARQDLERIAARCRSLRGEYEERYRVLRLRCVGYTLGAAAGLTCAAAAALALSR
ncbi:cytochrome C oxidase subunit I [Streptomyces sp. NPDC048208]|uniref:cytochrome C oxidase subunit I n=1 Tax=unclassified Streptomyces TaxID=2593676 RepID=UPI00136D7218|nr:cytochrome C oxidase subunit I [Streptomyces sp. SID4982]MYS12403.1 cytochrome C oxidase subunit I [Streptomyces sp. SID4982]